MLEGLIQSTLSNGLQKIFQQLEPDALSLALAQGELTLRKLQLRTDLVPGELGIELVCGYVDSISIKIPWAAFFSQKTILSIKGVYLLLRTKNEVSPLTTAD